MIRGLSRAGIGSVSDEQFITLAAKYGFGAVDLEAEALIASHGLEGAKELLEQHQMLIGSIGLNVEWRGSEEQFLEGLKGLAASASAASSLGCKSCCTYILPATDQNPALFMAQTVCRLRIISEVLGAYGIKLGLEFVGPHHLRTAWKNPFIWTVHDTLTLIDAIAQPNVGLLVDAYHCYTTGYTADDIRKQLLPEQIVHVHINDAYDLPVEQLLDNDRLYPGEGVIDLQGFVQSLGDIGYRGVVAQEVITPAISAGSPDDLFQRSKLGFDKVFS
ncbi:sugar phosphate isomerase/epimerase family protein [Paenibacillus segetis]|uniref:Sugar phosphate isomerase n=1 Tax=Paenibacillus segetis TaxID=1325360 RepID=A0ABQ1Y5S9_9BACL|nr:sugar phosphate isomerase/epimerase family protein [Paenibacillus segetis]GGH12331.1 sugar phosphate isomerase [Paenibacillus segetis]